MSESKLTPEEEAVFDRVLAKEIENAPRYRDDGNPEEPPVMGLDQMERIAEYGRKQDLSPEDQALFFSACRKLSSSPAGN
jgi:hypothetical protein